jgi:hypothetical protein
MMVREGGEALIEANLLRPHLYCGDALIFDCRILHFGLSNNAGRIVDVAGNVKSMSNPELLNSQGPDPPIYVIDASNISHEEWRPMLYINHHQYWFHDPKNWNDAEKLFPENTKV